MWCHSDRTDTSRGCPGHSSFPGLVIVLGPLSNFKLSSYKVKAKLVLILIMILILTPKL